MNPSARVQAAIDLLDTVLSESRPADGVIAMYFRNRKFFGAKDRRAVADQIWRILRHRARLSWALGTDQVSGRLLVAADLAQYEKKHIDAISGLFSGSLHGPHPFAPNERRMVMQAGSRDLNDAPREMRLEMPDWLTDKFDAAYGERADAEIAALQGEAPLDIRANLLKTTRDAVLQELTAEKLKTAPTTISPMGVRITGRQTLGNHAGFKDGRLEVQDEGSQLVSILANTLPGQAVMDLCAGAGGKTLAMAASMNNTGRIIACDVSVKRLERAKLRLRRAGVHNATLRVLETNDKWIKRQGESFDRVVIDAPCSGTGSWRRHPDSRWRFTPEALTNLTETQDMLLDQAAPLVKAGGRLVYITCSMLPDENQERVRAFLRRHTNFRVLPVAPVWRELLGTDAPTDQDMLTLTPASTNTDGFFIALLERV
jgi:16S rRNA (cytosine967-C5)-methyltransferase